MDSSLAIRQSVVLLVVLPTAIGIVSFLFDDAITSGVLMGFLMALLILSLLFWSNILGNPEHAGRFSDK